MVAKETDPNRPDWQTHRSGDTLDADCAYEHLFSRTFRVTAAAVRARGFTAPDAEEATMTAFAAEFQRRGIPLRERSSFQGFMIQGAWWAGQSERRSRWREFAQLEVVAAPTEEATANVSPPLGTPGDEAAWVALLRWQFPRLSDDEVTHVYLRCLDLSSTDIAAYLNITVANERTRWLRLRDLVALEYGIDLRECLR